MPPTRPYAATPAPPRNPITRRTDDILSYGDADTVVLDPADPQTRNMVRCKALEYAARYLRRILMEDAAVALEDRIVELGGEVDDDKTEVILLPSP